ncbi:ThiF family adenylyltransferase [Saccharothrix xinjiangensis]|uniref:ThiF family adenylyltransferase n=1 Tax=Saccharothrix xinjiangensis TaxID=204798 RepID=A0ABV9YCR7_9PSEU
MPGDGGVVRLLDVVSVVPCADGFRFVRGAESLRVRGPLGPLADAVDRLTSGVPERVEGAPVVARVAAALAERGWLTADAPGYGVGEPVERQVGYLGMFGADPVAMQRRLERASVAVLGVGGVGAIVAQHLVGAGVRDLWLIDHDTVAPHNLNRQFVYRAADVGSPKADRAAAALTSTAPGARVRAVRAAVREPGDLDVLPADLDLLVVAADTPPDLPDRVWAWARGRGVPVCGAAVGLETGYWGPLLDPRRGHCLPCFEARRTSLLAPADVEVGAALTEPTRFSFGPVNTAVSAFLAYEVVRFLASGTCSIVNARRHLVFPSGRTEDLDGVACQCPPCGDG